ncbi:hypothetical protein L1987_85490 [Smallanthus sonchifolius]|uniref:Uncharacterized protein n=1 Tax=Smallanthus sonchifolius TaxID=185202 RepID=A0ACB8XW07_9ASTR|nr:hypothetical protein L1987_85490 [Smallanthus sonchifolius]
MASTSGTAVIIPIVIILIAVINTVIVSAVREGELTVMFGVLRARGYHLFANAISTSDVHYDLKSDGNFTLLAPINSALFALDMTMPATNYVTTLRYHVLPRRMSMIDLLSLPPPSNFVPTLVPGRDILVEQRRSVRSLITVGGVDIVVPGMFYGRNMAVHGLGGILEYRHHTRNPPANRTVTGATLSNLGGNLTFRSPFPDLSNRSSPPPPVYNITGNYTFQFPVSIQSPLSSHRTQNQTVSSPDLTDGIDKQLPPSANQAPIHSASIDFRAEERKPRSKLLELRSDDTYSLSPATDPTGNRLLTPEDDKTLDCSLADNAGDQLKTGIHPRRLNIPSNMICAQK